jgi:hypothetical protein
MKTFEQFIYESNLYNFASARDLPAARKYLKDPKSRELPGISSKRRASIEQERATRLATAPTGTTISNKFRAALAAKVAAQKTQTENKPVQPTQPKERKQLEFKFMQYPQYLGATKPKLPKLKKTVEQPKTKSPRTKQLKLRGVWFQ